ncbi:NAD(P)/FAD-dependent oxidoreductase [Pelagimonas varians]|uniref:Protoporphyrinogen oxidase n=1 Tax=Pelagimonas varians TaxID=696760 RepID=A0A238KN38_9RHOB|nr:FAD-dependent oxidoreductase [Pelagimonas varians]PYG28931.1 putative NAD/FAD-binding protein [Pelagimonas varians]SMX44080.1 protoporphyrinogen oxidase [Pelagimonas varians]
MLDQIRGSRRKITIVGGGISGMAAAYYLSPNHDVTLYEAAPRLGGHARTVIAGKNGDQPVDTGFIVFNYATYPYLTRLFRDLNVPVEKSEMSFCASIDDGKIEYGLNSFKAISAQKRNLVRPQFYKMVADILRFGKEAEAAAVDDEITIGELVTKLGLGTWFRDNYLMPMCGAIWSTPAGEVDAFPAKSLIHFFRNHALLAGTGQHQWWTVKGGSIEYVSRLETALLARGVKIHTGTPVESVTRDTTGGQVQAQGQELHSFDDIILACHSDQALAILGAGATPAETGTLGAIRYQPNTAVLHCDETQMPKRRGCWSSWAYRSQEGGVGITYWMNRLQNIPESDPLFVTLNPSKPIPADKVYDSVEFAHPVFDKPALQAQLKIQEMQGTNNTWFAGAYNRNGFHEDGIASAMRIVRKMNSETAYATKGSDHDIDEQSPKVGIPGDLRATA